jgi:hypothetical protein
MALAKWRRQCEIMKITKRRRNESVSRQLKENGIGMA